MTEDEWLACADPAPMLEFLRGKASHRKLRLFACACCRRIAVWWNDLEKRAVEVAEQFAEGLVSEQECIDGRDAAYDPYAETDLGYQPASSCAVYAAAGPREHFDDNVVYVVRSCRLLLAYSGTESEIQANLLREIFGNPFRPVRIDPSWLSWNGGTIDRLAVTVYEERALPSGELDTARLAVLADALEEAGCTDANLLSHCRKPGPHARGCWVVDLLLDKT